MNTAQKSIIAITALVFVGSVFLLIFIQKQAKPVSDQQANTPPNMHVTQSPSIVSAQGIVVSVDASTITIRAPFAEGGGEKTFSFTNNTGFRKLVAEVHASTPSSVRKEQDTQRSSVKEGQLVIIYFNKDMSEALKILIVHE